ncbi:RNA 2',3'-cyclic phosphodiesterase [Candidatus Jorgensenbacteria bacterium CG_4_10_14_0_8_um_filter_39_13]|uniref:RNA 2',3'-cyclic phosphodiesterase n=2 Tax=Candidatus Joergenseniibacteriota TaxID=1752739 RepID=A0A2M7RH31_9BACT|nr:MAG: RNA 2',3'-cyclic phosphodiesterase [Candidatus Jorgensenbacteria bacterium CG11_big_fil_rev_8_21_14_0_20_38_23]PIV13416.1 MAG: RNA 2',3'-cyclic phosphodiesterase [Candidatus Jorgensenbacteria bacterium CG03_land_8_20_14_0_80_38_39]PIW97642.1 MAG: RNA 2',3'-cyclic phosphodiesterase [Candidatus Jorgensenbacteria bacterium CG_4_8_14_3_um_filter_38_10]PIY96069.1 MAG: RNA 2',3'-cyclic phosphodiesterase [Candidatus Jorgensenbacteria bacterium CG_4_10_14_0_8_um_filter_39_13]PJA95207.1 MAG: RNA
MIFSQNYFIIKIGINQILMLRLFVAFNLPPEIIDQISSLMKITQPLFKYGVRFLPPENWHLTLVFLSYQDEKNLSLVQEAIKNTVSQVSQPPQIELKELVYGPLSKTPRMIWLTTSEKTSQELNEVKNILEEELQKQGLKWKIENRKFQGHLTLARFFKYLKAGELPPLKKIAEPMEFEAESIDLMSSTLQRSGAVYEPLLKVDFRREI